MNTLAKITLSVALILSIAVPFIVFMIGEKTKGRYKKALAGNIFMFFGVMAIATVLFLSGNAYAAGGGTPAATAKQRQPALTQGRHPRGRADCITQCRKNNAIPMQKLRQITGRWQRHRTNQVPTLQNSKPIQFFNNPEHPECRNCEHHAERHLCTAKPHYRSPAKNVTF